MPCTFYLAIIFLITFLHSSVSKALPPTDPQKLFHIFPQLTDIFQAPFKLLTQGNSSSALETFWASSCHQKPPENCWDLWGNILPFGSNFSVFSVFFWACKSLKYLDYDRRQVQHMSWSCCPETLCFQAFQASWISEIPSWVALEHPITTLPCCTTTFPNFAEPEPPLGRTRLICTGSLAQNGVVHSLNQFRTSLAWNPHITSRYTLWYRSHGSFNLPQE